MNIEFILLLKEKNGRYSYNSLKIKNTHLIPVLGIFRKNPDPVEFSMYHSKVGGGIAVALQATFSVSLSVEYTVWLHLLSPSFPRHWILGVSRFKKIQTISVILKIESS